MKLNPNCIRDILITVEENSDFIHQTEYRKGTCFKHFQDYSHEEIIYHIKQCELSGLIYDVHYYDAGSCILIRDLSPIGHEFLTNIRNDAVWKKLLIKGMGASLPILIEMAKAYAMNYFLG